MVAAYVMTETIGGRVKRLRASRKWTQGQLAMRADVGRPWLSLVELDRIEEPRAVDLDRVARALGVDVHYLLTGESPVGEFAVPVDPEKAGIAERILRQPLATLRWIEDMLAGAVHVLPSHEQANEHPGSERQHPDADDEPGADPHLRQCC